MAANTVAKRSIANSPTGFAEKSLHHLFKTFITKNPAKGYLTGFVFIEFDLAHFELFLNIVNVSLKFLICIY